MKKTADFSQLVVQLKQGNERAVSRWFYQFQSTIKLFIQQRVSNPADIEDLVQKTFIDCLRQIALLRHPNKLKSWMLNIARAKVADHYRKLYAKKVIRHLPLGEMALSLNTYDLPTVSEAVVGVLNQMSSYSRELLLKKYVDQQSIAQIARDQSVSIKTIESRLYRARIEFKTIYAKPE